MGQSQDVISCMQPEEVSDNLVEGQTSLLEIAWSLEIEFG